MLRTRDPAYLAQELFSNAWDPTSIADLAERVSAAEVDFIGYGFLTENMPADSKNETGYGGGLYFTVEEQLLLRGLREGVSVEAAADEALSLFKRRNPGDGRSREDWVHAARRVQSTFLPIGTALGLL